MDSMSPARSLPAEIHAWVEAECGPLAHVLETPGRSASSARVFRIRGERTRAFVKWHREPRRFQQELAFYTRFAALLRDSTPALIAAETSRRLLLLSVVEGRPGLAFSRAGSARVRMFEEAGRFARTLHAVRPDQDDPMPVERALVERARAMRRAASTPELLRRLGDLESELSDLIPTAATRSLCHRDFQPDNWLFDPEAGSGFRVLDFEHSRGDLSLFDLARLDLLQLSRDPEAADAFWSGYGGAPAGDEHELYQRVKLMEAARTTLWAERHADSVFADEARRMWQALKRRS